MRFVLISLCLFLLTPIFSHSNASNPLVFVLSDFDGTVTSLTTWNTPARLRKLSGEFDDYSYYLAIEFALGEHNIKYNDLPHVIEISQEEDSLLREHIARNEDGRIKVPSYQIWRLPADPKMQGRQKDQIIIPGIYRKTYEENFRDDAALLNDYEQAKQVSTKTKRPLFNMGFPLVKKALESDYSKVYIHTARGQSPEAFLKLFKQIQKEQALKSTRSWQNNLQIFPMNRPEGARYGIGAVNRKVALAKDVLMEIAQIKKSQGDAVDTHIVFSEDDVRVIYEVNKLFESSSKDRFIQSTYMHILFTGSNEELKKLEVQDGLRFITYHNGRKSQISKAHAQMLGLEEKELRFYTEHIAKRQTILRSGCRELFN